MRTDLRGRFIVQDLAKETNGRELAEGVEVMAFDFMLPQPIKIQLLAFISHSRRHLHRYLTITFG